MEPAARPPGDNHDQWLSFDILPQPDDLTCGPTCLHAIYRHYGDELPLDQVIREVAMLTGGGTLAVFLGCHALARGYEARIYTYNLQVFDPTWFRPGAPPLAERLRAQKETKDWPKLHFATEAYLEFLRLGGDIRMKVLDRELIRKYLRRGIPLLTGLSATFLYAEARERTLDPAVPGRLVNSVPDDIGGFPVGHFVVLCGYDSDSSEAVVADPLWPNPLADRHLYAIDLDRVLCSILLGIWTYDANFLVIRPRKGKDRARSDRH